jgi:hypothetical protein
VITEGVGQGRGNCGHNAAGWGRTGMWAERPANASKRPTACLASPPGPG